MLIRLLPLATKNSPMKVNQEKLRYKLQVNSLTGKFCAQAAFEYLNKLTILSFWKSEW